jgi:type III restriction enzyme
LKQVVIENPVINSAFKEPSRHFKFTEEGITDETVESRRTSAYFVPIAPPKKKGKQGQLSFDTEWTEDRLKENKFINRVRERVAMWRSGGHIGVTGTTSRLLEYWSNPDREKKLFFCQIEALETVIYITEVARKYGDAWIENELQEAGGSANSQLFRMAFKMATGSGKTVVMAMLIAWHTLNKLANPQNATFSDTFLIVAPGITIRDRLRVLLPNDPHNYYRERDVVSAALMAELGKAKIIITNFHGFQLREKTEAGRLTKKLLSKGVESPFTETPDQMVRRVCRDLGNKRNIVVINDEAHHCYRRREMTDEEKLTGDERKEAEKRDAEARVWISGLEAIKKKIGVKTVYDLSATPFFLRGSGYPEGTLFPWVISDFSLIDAIESGIVKVPRVPVSDDSMVGELPTYRDLWPRIKDALPKKGRKTEAITGEPHLPAELEGALHALYGNYEKVYRTWAAHDDARRSDMTPPVYIVVCNNTNVSKLLFDYIAGWEKKLPDGSAVLVPGGLGIFSNVGEAGQWTAWPNTILIDSEQLESGDAMSPQFKKIATAEIDEFKMEYRLRFPGRDAEDLTDEDLLREVMNTVGKPGKLGEQIKCVISVSMLSEGWDASTVTHILGVRAFGTQLLCEQVVGRGLRRISYSTDEKGMFQPEYAEVYGVPFSFIPCSGSTEAPKPGPTPTRVRALEERIASEMSFPRVTGYRYDLPSKKLSARFTEDSQMTLSTADIPTKVQLDPIVGESSVHTLEGLKNRRDHEVAFYISKLVLEHYFKDDEGNLQFWLFPQILAVTREWIRDWVLLKDDTFPQLLLLVERAHGAAERVYAAIVRFDQGKKVLKPMLQPYDTLGSTRYVDFDTTRPVYRTSPQRCHISHVVADTDSWEQKVAASLEDMDEVISYAKNQNLGFTIPYTINGQEKNYYPDFLVYVNDGHGRTDPLKLIIEVTGETKKDKPAKTATARTLWVPAINNHGGFGRWAYLEITDPWNAKNAIRDALVQRGGRE